MTEPDGHSMMLTATLSTCSCALQAMQPERHSLPSKLNMKDPMNAIPGFTEAYGIGCLQRLQLCRPDLLNLLSSDRDHE